MKILITGPNGFLSRNLIDRMQSTNHEILEVSYRDSLVDHKKTIIEYKPDVTIHFAWSGGNSYKDSTSSNQLYKNIPQSIELLSYLKQCNKKQTFIGFGTACEYGKFDYQIKESDPENPFDLYGMSKLAFKNYSQLFCKIENMNWIWIRPFYTYGQKDVKTRLIPKVISALLKNENIVLDECKSTVDYLHVDDFTDAMVSIVESHNSINGVYNICSKNEYTVREVLSTISELIPNSGKVIFDPSLNKDKQKYTCGDNSKIKNTIDWRPKTSLKEGLKKTIDYIKNETP